MSWFCFVFHELYVENCFLMLEIPLIVKEFINLCIISQLNVKDLHGKKVDLKKTGKSTIKGESGEAPIYFEFSETDNNDSIFRPLVSSLIDGSIRLGPNFTSTVVVQDSVIELPSVAATDAEDLPVSRLIQFILLL